LYFYSTRPGGLGSQDIWTAARLTSQGDFSAPTLLAEVNSSAFDAAPWVSADELTMTFVSDRQPGVGGADIYIATRNSPTVPFSPPVLLGGTAVNSPSNEDRAVMTRDGLTVYFGSGPRQRERGIRLMDGHTDKRRQRLRRRGHAASAQQPVERHERIHHGRRARTLLFVQSQRHESDKALRVGLSVGTRRTKNRAACPSFGQRATYDSYICFT
jgi:hypothetical protein